MTIKSTRNTTRFTYGKVYNEHYDIGIIDGHYFLNEVNLPITRYFLNNYEKVKDEREANLIRNLEKGRHNNGKKYYKRIKVYAEIYNTIHYDKIIEDFPCLTYDEDICVVLDEEVIKKKKKIKRRKVFFDFETCFRTFKKVDDDGKEKTNVC